MFEEFKESWQVGEQKEGERMLDETQARWAEVQICGCCLQSKKKQWEVSSREFRTRGPDQILLWGQSFHFGVDTDTMVGHSFTSAGYYITETRARVGT